MPPGGIGNGRRTLDALLPLVRIAGYGDMEAGLLAEHALLEAAVRKIAVIGDPGTGKSTFIRHAFLNGEILPQSPGTAVPTELCHGPEARMAIFPYLERAHGPVRINGNSTGLFTALGACEGPPALIDDPTPAQIRRHVWAATPAARALLYHGTARVRVTLPAPALEGLMIVDTPGMGPLTRPGVYIRYRLLPACDGILLSGHPGSLSTALRSLLESPMAAGRDVQRLPREWPETKGRHRRVETATASRGGPDPSVGKAAARAESAAADWAALALARCAAELGILNLPAGDRPGIRRRISALEKQVRARQAGVMTSLAGDLADLAAEMSALASREIGKVMARTAGGMNGPFDAPDPLLARLESAVAGVADQITARTASLADHYASRRRRLLEAWEDGVRRELGPRAVPCPAAPFGARVMEMIALARFNPFGILADILPGILAPEGLAPGKISVLAREIRNDMPQRVEAMLRPVTEILPTEWDDDVSRRLAAVRQGGHTACGSFDPGRRPLLTDVMKALERLADAACARIRIQPSNRSDQ